METDKGATRSEVTLNTGSEVLSIPGDRVYFAFASGRFTYDCVECGAKCCNGHGYDIRIGDELRAHLARAPIVRFFLSRCDAENEGHYHVRNLAPHCFFLDGEQMCVIHKEFGSDAKPQTCRLFPFNNFLRVGGHLVVAPHTTLCPLQITPSHRSNDYSDHDAQLARLSARPLNIDVGVGTPLAAKADAAIALERRIVAMSEAHLDSGDYLRFAAAQLEATRESHGDNRDTGDAHGELSRFQAELYDVLGVPIRAESSAGASLARVMVACTPAVRAQLIFQRRNVVPPHIAMPAGRVPHALLALYAFVRFAHEAGMGEVTYQTIMRVLGNQGALLALLAQVDRVLVWDADAVVDLTYPGDAAIKRRYATVVQTLLPKRQHRARLSLGAILRSTAPVDAFTHSLFLGTVARKLAGRLVPIEQYQTYPLSRRLFAGRSVLQRWIFDVSNVEYLTTLSARGRVHG